jgi:RNA polymerase sigma-70 factor (ECF subfamily)
LDQRGQQPRTEREPRSRGDLIPLAEERAVIHRLQQGDRSAVAVLYGWYGDLLFRQAILPRLPVTELAEDCLRDTFRTVLEKIDTWRDEDRSIFFWLHRIAVNKAIDVHRRRRRDLDLETAVRAEDPDDIVQVPPAPDRQLEVDDTRRMVETSLSRMNERYASALRLRLLDERPREECASLMGVTVGNFDVILHRAAKAFRQVYPP